MKAIAFEGCGGEDPASSQFSYIKHLGNVSISPSDRTSDAEPDSEQ